MAKKPQTSQPAPPSPPEPASASDPVTFDLDPVKDPFAGVEMKREEDLVGETAAPNTPTLVPVVERQAFAEAMLNLPPPLTDAERVDRVLRNIEQPISSTIVAKARLDLTDLSVEEQVELAITAHEIIGKASGYLPDFHSATENMKGAYMNVVRHIWLAAQRKARTYNE